MDPVSQIALGAAVGETVLGRRVGRRAPVWGGLCGLLPNLDVLWPFADAVPAFTWHCGYSHAFVVLALSTPLVAWAAVRIHPATRAHWRGWLLLAFLALVTPPILDCFTVYGTRVLLPFSATGGLVDDLHNRPLFTAPLVIGQWLCNACLVIGLAFCDIAVRVLGTEAEGRISSASVEVPGVDRGSAPAAGHVQGSSGVGSALTTGHIAQPG